MTTQPLYGFLNIAKPTGMTSHDVVATIRRIVGKSTKVGHAGTLDPSATGVLPLALGPATRLIEYLVNTPKGYHATICLGVTTTTDDADGEVIAQHPIPPIPEAHIESLLDSFRGDIMQVPPMYAAIHHQGQRLYDLARDGKIVERSPRPVTIEHLELVEIMQSAANNPCGAIVKLDITCSKGTYIRALARDLGDALGCGAHLAALERTRTGPFTIDTAHPLARFVPISPPPPPAHVIYQALMPPEVVISEWPAVIVTDLQAQRIRHGMALVLDEEYSDAERLRAHTHDGILIALLRRHGNQWTPGKVLIPR